MLKDVYIDDFRSCMDLHIDDIGGVLALLGRNGAGKTNILRAIEWAARSARSTKSLTLDEHSAMGHQRKVILEVDLAGEMFKYTIILRIERIRDMSGNDKPEGVDTKLTESVFHRPAGGGEWHSVVERDQEIVTLSEMGKTLKIGNAAPCLPALSSLLPEDHPINRQVGPLLRFFAGIRYYPLDEPSTPESPEDAMGVIPAERYAQWLNRFKTTTDPGNSVTLRILHMSMERPEQYEELRSLLGENGLGLINTIAVVKFQFPPAKETERIDQNTKIYHYVSFSPVGGLSKDTFDYSDLSVGTRRVIRILVSMLFDDSSVLLMEQPEDAIHPGLMKKLTGLLKSNAMPLQFILASHSADVFNKLTPNEVRLVTISDGRTSLRALNAKETLAAERYMDREGAFSDFLETVTGE